MYHVTTELVMEIIASLVESSTMIWCSMQMNYKYPAETLTPYFICEIHENIAERFEAHCVRARKTEMPADVICPAVAKRNQRKYHCLPSLTLCDGGGERIREPFIEKSVTENGQIRAMLFEDTTRKDDHRFGTVQPGEVGCGHVHRTKHLGS